MFSAADGGLRVSLEVSLHAILNNYIILILHIPRICFLVIKWNFDKIIAMKSDGTVHSTTDQINLTFLST